MSQKENAQQKLTAFLYRHIDKPNMLAHMLLRHGCLSEGFLNRLHKNEPLFDDDTSMGDISTFSELEKFMAQHVFKPHKEVVTCRKSVIIANMQAHLRKCIEEEEYESARNMKKHIDEVTNLKRA